MKAVLSPVRETMSRQTEAAGKEAKGKGCSVLLIQLGAPWQPQSFLEDLSVGVSTGCDLSHAESESTGTGGL